MRRRIGIVVACSAVAIAGAAPATAADLSGADVAQAYSIMMTNAEGKSLTGGSKMMNVFAVSNSGAGSVDDPWLCDLSGSNEVEGKGGDNIVSVEYLSQKGQAVGDASQDIHVYASAARAKKAYDDLVKKVKRCEGQHQPSGDEGGVDGDEPGGLTTQLTNGTKKAADGDPFLWVRSTTTIPGVDGFAEHAYTTVRHFGKYLQIVQVQEEGSGATDLTKKQIRTADRLTDSLGDRWRATFN
jgi:hypothetical protein